MPQQGASTYSHYSEQNAYFRAAYAPLEAGSAELNPVEALLALKRSPQQPRPAVEQSAGRARPGPLPKSGFRGVTRHIKGMLNAQVWVGHNRQMHVGGFPTALAAAAAHDIAALVVKGPDAKLNFPETEYVGLWEHLQGKDWPALRSAIKAIVKDDMGLCDPETASFIEAPGASGPVPVPTPRVGSKRERESPVMPPNPPPAKRLRFDDSPEPPTSGTSGSPLPGQHESSQAQSVRKSGRACRVSGRIIALNGDDPKLSHPARRRPTRHLSEDVMSAALNLCSPGHSRYAPHWSCSGG